MRMLGQSAKAFPLACVLALASACSHPAPQAHGPTGPRTAAASASPSGSVNATSSASPAPTPSLPVAPMHFDSIAFGTPKDGWAAGTTGPDDALVVSQ